MTSILAGAVLLASSGVSDLPPRIQEPGLWRVKSIEEGRTYSLEYRKSATEQAEQSGVSVEFPADGEMILELCIPPERSRTEWKSTLPEGCKFDALKSVADTVEYSISCENPAHSSKGTYNSPGAQEYKFVSIKSNGFRTETTGKRISDCPSRVSPKK
jgi:hypothetical protein